ncbi:MAG: leucine-rich repeat domain-containing protein [Oscillospiraceae bacterium]|nr:leucine-rich repeat domain-containing protein [Oscillospiraceae bacterium]
MNIKKIILPLLTAAIALTACNKNNDADPVQTSETSVTAPETSSYAADKVTPADNFEYAVKNGEVKLKKYIGSDTKVVIPEYIEGCPVVKYSRYLFSNTDVTEITFPSTITNITALTNAENLETINISSSVEKLLPVDLRTCTALKNINAEKGGTFSSADGVLYSADGKTLMCFPMGRTGEFTVPDYTRIIGENAFYQSMLTRVDLPEGLELIRPEAFYRSSLTEITIPSSVTEIGDSAFMNSSLKTVTLNDGLKIIGAKTFAFTDIEEIYLPDSIESCGLLFGDDRDKKISAPLSAMYSEEMSLLYGQENISYRGETDLDVLVRKAGDLNEKWNIGRVFIDLNGDGLPEMAEVSMDNRVKYYEFDTIENEWNKISEAPVDFEAKIYYDTENDVYLFLYPDFPYPDIPYDYLPQYAYEYYIGSEYQHGKFFNGGNAPELYNEIVSGAVSGYELVNTVNIQNIIDRYGEKYKKYEIVMSDFGGTSSWNGVPVTEFPYSVKWYPTGMNIKADGKDILGGEAVDGITYEDGKLLLDGLNIEGEIFIQGIDELEIVLKGNNNISDLKFIGTYLTIKGDGTLSAEIIRPQKYNTKTITICEDARIISKDDYENATKLNDSIKFTNINVMDNGYLETPSISGDSLMLSGNARVRTMHCDYLDRIVLEDNSIMEVVSEYEKYPKLEITYELRHCMHCTPQISVGGSSRLSVVCDTVVGIDCYGHLDSKVTVSGNGVIEISGSSSSYGLFLEGSLAALTMNDNALITINGFDYALRAHKIEINGGTLDIHSDNVAAYIDTATLSETGLFINGDVVSQSSDLVFSPLEPDITYKLALSSAETGEILKDFSITVKEKPPEK